MVRMIAQLVREMVPADDLKRMGEDLLRECLQRVPDLWDWVKDNVDLQEVLDTISGWFG